MESIEQLESALEERLYFADRSLATALFLALRLERPVLLEGAAGVGKTEVARALAAALDRRLIRLQCYEGLDVNTALYEWDYARQMLHIRLLEAAGPVDPEAARDDLFSPPFLLRRPLLQALESEPGRGAPVLLIDELDRADEEFEAFLLEILADFQVTVPELGTLRAERPPLVVITSNRTREIHDALRRRCLYHWLDYPSFERELRVVTARLRGAPESLGRRVVAFVQALRRRELYKPPGVAETLDWLAALLALERRELSAEVVEATLGVVLKYQDDLERIGGEVVEELLRESAAAG